MKTSGKPEDRRPSRMLRHVAVYFPPRASEDTLHRWQMPRLIVSVPEKPAPETERVLWLEEYEGEEG